MTKRIGRPRRGKELMVTLSGRVPPEIKAKVEQLSQDEQVTASVVLCRLLEQGLAVESVLSRRSAAA